MLALIDLLTRIDHCINVTSPPATSNIEVGLKKNETLAEKLEKAKAYALAFVPRGSSSLCYRHRPGQRRIVAVGCQPRPATCAGASRCAMCSGRTRRCFRPPRRRPRRRSAWVPRSSDAVDQRGSSALPSAQLRTRGPHGAVLSLRGVAILPTHSTMFRALRAFTSKAQKEAEGEKNAVRDAGAAAASTAALTSLLPHNYVAMPPQCRNAPLPPPRHPPTARWLS